MLSMRTGPESDDRMVYKPDSLRSFRSGVLLCLWTFGMFCLTTQGEEIESATSAQRYEFQRIRMGVPWKMAFYASSTEQAALAERDAFARIQEIDRILSDYDPDSELNQVCRNAKPGQPMSVSPDLFFVLQSSLKYADLSGGAFDVTVGHITDLWRRAYRKSELPEEIRLQAALALTGYQAISLDPGKQTVTLQKAEMKLDFGGIAKGYAADEAMKVLRKHGITSALIDASGDLVVSDAPPDRQGWVIGIAPLKRPEGEPEQFLQLVNCSVATSGDASRYVEIDGVRYSHLVNPQTGIGLTESSSVTVIAPDGTTSDALASVVSVMGAERGFKILPELKAEALVVTRPKGKEVSVQTCGFSRYLVPGDDSR
ncbi:MAG: FAD:protein FMN transferase [Planctomycetaceae bacterium]|nr:FAD:protein FMN transferase [Planctomycetaceae bacterium]